MRARGRIDATHAEIVAELRACGYSVLSLANVGHGCPDLLVARAGRMWLLEVKRPTGPDGGTAHSKLTGDQLAFRARWPSPIGVVRSRAEALRYVGALAEAPTSRPAAIVDPGAS